MGICFPLCKKKEKYGKYLPSGICQSRRELSFSPPLPVFFFSHRQLLRPSHSRNLLQLFVFSSVHYCEHLIREKQISSGGLCILLRIFRLYMCCLRPILPGSYFSKYCLLWLLCLEYGPRERNRESMFIESAATLICSG